MDLIRLRYADGHPVRAVEHLADKTSYMNHERLQVWLRALDLMDCTHRAVESFSPQHRFAYGDQFRRAAVSVGANIAEGAARKHRRELIQFLYIARGSLSELHTLSRFATRNRLAPVDTLAGLDEVIDHVGRMLTRMIKALGS